MSNAENLIEIAEAMIEDRENPVVVGQAIEAAVAAAIESGDADLIERANDLDGEV